MSEQNPKQNIIRFPLSRRERRRRLLDREYPISRKAICACPLH